MSQPNEKTVAVIGAGPVGLAAAAHLLERGLKPTVLEAGAHAGHSVRHWSHVHLFSPWAYNIDKASRRLLETVGWNSPDPDHYPTGAELIEGYIQPLATRTALRDYIHTSSRVVDISRVGFDKVKSEGREKAPFEIRYRNGVGIKSVLADAIIDASGTWNSPNRAGANGLAAIGEDLATSCVAYGMPDVLGSRRDDYEGRTVAVLGAGHSATGTLLNLVELKKAAPKTRVLWVIRGSDPSKSFGGGANDKLAARGELGSELARVVGEGQIEIHHSFHVSHVAESDQGIRIGAGSACCGRHVAVDRLIVATGFRPDLDFLRELRVSLDPALECPPILAPMIDPNVHSCGTVRPHGAQELAHPEPGLYVAGIKSYGRAPTFLMATGYEQVRSIAAQIAGDNEAARRVELELPETGVCSRGAAPGAKEATCCGGPAQTQADGCCRDDTVAKADGKTGCGCSTEVKAPAQTLTAACCGGASKTAQPLDESVTA